MTSKNDLIIACIVLWIFFAITGTAEVKNVRVLILGYPLRPHVEGCEQRKDDISRQITSVSQDVRVTVDIVHELFDQPEGDWLIAPLVSRLADESPIPSWTVLIQEHTQIRLPKLISLLSKFNENSVYLLGKQLATDTPIRPHRFEEAGLPFPEINAGIALSRAFVLRFGKAWKTFRLKSSVIPDPVYEFAKFVDEVSDSEVNIEHSKWFCSGQDAENCATFYPRQTVDVSHSISADDLLYIVKTSEATRVRLKLLWRSWGHTARHILLVGDYEDQHVLKSPVPNVDRGHCEKTMLALRWVHQHRTNFKYYVLVDDDTLLSDVRLRSLLAPYDWSAKFVLGDRFGLLRFFDGQAHYIPYIATGGGMVMTQSVLHSLMQLPCACKSIEDPDDSELGLCLYRLNITVMHSFHFNQFCPVHMTPERSELFQHVSSHDIHPVHCDDPYKVYTKYLGGSLVQWTGSWGNERPALTKTSSSAREQSASSVRQHPEL